MTVLIITISRVRQYPRLLILAVLLFATGCTDGRDYSPARLSGLFIEGTKTNLNPSFDPEVFRYSVIADDPPNAVSLTSFADQSVIISIDGRRTTSGVAESIGALTPGDTIGIKVERPTPVSGLSAIYEIIYLPPDFPELEVSVLESGVSSDPLYVNLNGPESSYIAVLNNHGVPSFYKKDEQRMFDFKWHAATGERSYIRLTGSLNQWGRRDSEVVVLGANFGEVERVVTVDLSHTDNHDFLILPNDELLLLSYDGSIRDLTAFGLSAEEVVEDSVVQIIDRATRTVLFEWNSWDQVPYQDQAYPELRGEYAHVNSAIVDTDNNIIISARGTSQVVKISRPGGQVLWKLGGKSNQFDFVNDPYSYICGQHTASRLENGNLLLFDNGQNCWPIEPSRGELTRIVEYQIDEQSLKAELVWSYSQEGAYTISQGSAQRLTNGNTLIGWGRGPGILATELSSNGTKVFEIIASSDGEPVVGYRANRFPE